MWTESCSIMFSNFFFHLGHNIVQKWSISFRCIVVYVGFPSRLAPFILDSYWILCSHSMINEIDFFTYVQKLIPPLCQGLFFGQNYFLDDSVPCSFSFGILQHPIFKDIKSTLLSKPWSLWFVKDYRLKWRTERHSHRVHFLRVLGLEIDAIGNYNDVLLLE